MASRHAQLMQKALHTRAALLGEAAVYRTAAGVTTAFTAEVTDDEGQDPLATVTDRRTFVASAADLVSVVVGDWIDHGGRSWRITAATGGSDGTGVWVISARVANVRT